MASSSNGGGCGDGGLVSEFTTAITTDIDLGTNNGELNPTPASTSGSEPSSFMYVSARIQRLMQHKSRFPSEVQFETECSKAHWSELRTENQVVAEALKKKSRWRLPYRELGRVFLRPWNLEKQRDQEMNQEILKVPETNHRILESLETNREIFESLCMSPQWGRFFNKYGDQLRLGRKIGEGAQAQIFEERSGSSVLKVFKKGYSLRDLQRQWPEGMLQRENYSKKEFSFALYGGVLLNDGRFAFWMKKYDGDLRNLIDDSMRQKNNQGSPFSCREDALECMWQIAKGMAGLHEENIVHRDLKASNVLVTERVSRTWSTDIERKYFVADFESSVGVVGTGFWRAPEILFALKNKKITLETFTEKSDVYSYAMTCYEILTGCIPFEDRPLADYDIVLSGGRPKLPTTIEPEIKHMLLRCWHGDPSKRPTFHSILSILSSSEDDQRCPCASQVIVHILYSDPAVRDALRKELKKETLELEQGLAYIEEGETVRKNALVIEAEEEETVLKNALDLYLYRKGEREFKANFRRRVGEGVAYWNLDLLFGLEDGVAYCNLDCRDRESSDVQTAEGNAHAPTYEESLALAYAGGNATLSFVDSVLEDLLVMGERKRQRYSYRSGQIDQMMSVS